MTDAMRQGPKVRLPGIQSSGQIAGRASQPAADVEHPNALAQVDQLDGGLPAADVELVDQGEIVSVELVPVDTGGGEAVEDRA